MNFKILVFLALAATATVAYDTLSFEDRFLQTTTTSTSSNINATWSNTSATLTTSCATSATAAATSTACAANHTCATWNRTVISTLANTTVYLCTPSQLVQNKA